MSSLETFNEFDLLQAVHHAFQLPENAPQIRSKPRASGLTEDARVLAYSMANTPKSNPQSENPDWVDMGYTQEQGRQAEGITIAALSLLGWEITDRQIELPPDYWVTGHPDGLCRRTLFESKMFGDWMYGEIAKNGIWGEVGRKVLAQCAVYCDALDLDDVLIVIVSQDGRYMRRRFNREKAFKNRGIHPKVQLFRIDRADIQHLIPTLKTRADWFTDWMANDGNPANVAWESDPAVTYGLWPGSEWRDRAIADGPGHLVAPPSFSW